MTRTRHSLRATSAQVLRARLRLANISLPDLELLLTNQSLSPASLLALAASTPYGSTRTSGPSASSSQAAPTTCTFAFSGSGQRAAHLGPRGRRVFRIMQSRAREAERESHCYVDDPGFALAATVAWRRKLTLARNFLLLLCLG